MTKKRIFVFDFLRVILIFLVVHLHLLSQVTHAADTGTRIELLAVPLFLVLSFYLNGKYFTEEPMRKMQLFERLKRLAAPLVFWTAVSFLTHPSVSSLQNFFQQLFYNNVFSTPLYYLNLLIYYTLLCYLISLLPERFRLTIFTFIIFLAFVLQYTQLNYMYFANSDSVFSGRFIELIPFAMTGLIFSLFSESLSKRIWLSGGIILFSIVGLILSKNIPDPNGFRYQGLGYFFATVLIFLIFLLSTKLAWQKILHARLTNIIHSLGKYTFGIYLFHLWLYEAILFFVPSLKLFILSHSYIFLIIFIPICYVLCIAFDKLLKGRFFFTIR